MYKQVFGAEVIAKSSELEAYFQWAFDNGIRLNKVLYPCRYPLGYMGIVATENVGPHETVVSVPNNLLITTRVAENSELGDLFREYDEFFDEDEGYYEDMVLVTYLIWEKNKGEQSKWFHFIRNQPKEYGVLQDWNVEELQQLQDPEVVYDVKQQMAATMKRYTQWKKILLKSKVFTTDMTDYKEYLWALRALSTRSFGKFCPYTTFAPIAEFFNHHNTVTYYYYGTFEASVESAKRYVNFSVGEDHDDELILKKPVDYISWRKVLKMVSQQEIRPDSPLFKLVKEAESIDNEERKKRENLDYGKPDPELLIERNEKALSIITGNEIYEVGSEVYMSYGRYSNWMLLNTYGFALQDNIYDYARIITTLEPFSSENRSAAIRNLDSSSTYMFKIKPNIICKELLRIIRVLNWTDKYKTDACFSPGSAELELTALNIMLKVLNDRLLSYPTTLNEDLEQLRTCQNVRIHFAVTHK